MGIGLFGFLIIPNIQIPDKLIIYFLFLSVPFIEEFLEEWFHEFMPFISHFLRSFCIHIVFELEKFAMEMMYRRRIFFWFIEGMPIKRYFRNPCSNAMGSWKRKSPAYTNRSNGIQIIRILQNKSFDIFCAFSLFWKIIFFMIFDTIKYFFLMILSQINLIKNLFYYGKRIFGRTESSVFFLDNSMDIM